MSNLAYRSSKISSRLLLKNVFFIKDNVPCRDNDTFIWNPDLVDIGRVIANKVADMGLQI